MNKFSHGGNVYHYADILGYKVEEILDLSSNISPFVDSGVFKLIKSNLDSLNRLPSPNGMLLKKALAERFNRDCRNFVVGVGTSELIKNICLINEGKRALIVTPTYVDYEKYCRLYGLDVDFYNADEGQNFKVYLSQIDFSFYKLAFICNPNNPTGNYIAKDNILKVAGRYKNCIFVIDESYLPFMLNHDKETLLFEDKQNIVVLRSFSKIYGLAGLRVGYAYSFNKETIKNIEEHCLEWGISSLSEIVSTYLISTDTTDTDLKIQEIKDYVYNHLITCDKVRVYSSVANFLLIKLKNLKSDEVFDKLLTHKILVRDCKNIRGLDDSFIRVSIKDLSSMRRFLDIFKRIMGCEN